MLRYDSFQILTSERRAMHAYLGFFITPIGLVVWVVGAFFFWLIWYGLHAGLNSGQLGRGRYWVFECFGEEVLENIPGGLKRKSDKIRQMVGRSGKGVMCGVTRGYDFEEIRRDNLYEEVAREMFPPPAVFWFSSVLIPVVWPVVIPLFVVCAALGLLLAGAAHILGFAK
jgi:hypothetical protein